MAENDERPDEPKAEDKPAPQARPAMMSVDAGWDVPDKGKPQAPAKPAPPAQAAQPPQGAAPPKPAPPGKVVPAVGPLPPKPATTVVRAASEAGAAAPAPLPAMAPPPLPPMSPPPVPGRPAPPRRASTVATGAAPPAAPAAPPAAVAPAAPAEAASNEPVTLGVELTRRAERITSADPVAAARALVERGLVEERVEHDRIAARRSFAAARSITRSLGPALSRLRHLFEPEDRLERISVLDDELVVAESDAERADLLVERARATAELGRWPEARAAYGKALELVHAHPHALRGLEAVLRRELERAKGRDLAESLAKHLERMADAYAPEAGKPDGDARLAAWLHVERAAVLDDMLQQPALATAALERAVNFEPAPGPVRAALARHHVRHDDPRALCESLSAEAEHELDDDRASRLLYTAARIQCERLRDPHEAIALLGRATSRAPAGTPTSRRILAELSRLQEQEGALEQASITRKRELATLTGQEAIAHAHVRLSEIYDALGQAENAGAHAEQALLHDPVDESTRERLDRALQRLGRHERRVEVWAAEGNAERPAHQRVASLMRAADICERHLRKREDAIAYLKAAWTVNPGDAAVFDTLTALLEKPAREPDAAVRARIDLYAQSAHAQVEAPRKIALLEKLVSIWEDELGQPERAMEVLDQILALDPVRRTAFLAMQRNAQRASDYRRLGQALVAESELTEDPALKRKLLLRAADVVGERVGDRDRAIELVDRALAVKATDPDALRARFRLLSRAGRNEEAKQALLGLIRNEPAGSFGLWVEVARFDELRLKRPQEAVKAYEEAARLRPDHPMPGLEIMRLLRATGDHRRLVTSLKKLAEGASGPIARASFLFQAAEVEELLLGDDQAALATLSAADALSSVAEGAFDPAVVEAMERILVRRRATDELAALYAGWLARHPTPSVDHAIRIAFADVLCRKDRREAVSLLEGLITVVPDHVPALRMLEHLHRSAQAVALADVLRVQAAATRSVVARTGALAHLVTLEERIPSDVVLDALGRVVAERPADSSVHDAIIRIAGRLVEGAISPASTGPAGALLLASITARKSLAREPFARGFFQLEEAILVEAKARGGDASLARASLAGYRDTLALFPDSLLAARGLDRLAGELGDRAALITANRALARIVEGAARRAGHLVRAAQLTAEEPGLMGEALELYENALREDPDCEAAARALARGLAPDPARLAERLGTALERAASSAQIVLLGTEIGRAVLRHHEAGGSSPDPSIGVAAMRRVLAETPDDVTALMLTARLYTAQRLPAEARDAWQRIVSIAAVPEARTAAYFELAILYEGPLADLPRAEQCVQAVLSTEPSHAFALDRLYQIAAKRGDHALAVHALTRLADASPDARTRVDVCLRLAEAQREAGDRAGIVRALCDAIAHGPTDMRPWGALARQYRVETPDGAAQYVAAIGQVLEIASARRLPIDPRWLTTIGLLEVTVLVRPRDGVAHLQQAVGLPNAGAEARAALGRGLDAANRNAEAVQVLRDVLATDIDALAKTGELSAALAALESALAKDGRAEERLTVEETRACLGDVKPERITRLRARRMPPDAPHLGVFAGAELHRLLVAEAQSPMLLAAAAIAPIAHKALRFELSSLGVSSRDRIGSRDNSSTYRLADRIAKSLGVEGFELYLSQSWQGMPRVYPGDPPAIVGPVSFAELPEPEQAFALGRLFVRIALGPTWLDELALESCDALLIAAMRCVDPSFGARDLGPVREQAAQAFGVHVQRAIGRRQRKLLEEILPSAAPGYDIRLLAAGVRRSENRLGYLLSGDLVAAIDHLCRIDRDVARAAEDPRLVVLHPVTGDLLRYALGPASYAERRRAGTVWTNA
ncbi:cellulose synthase [Polyangium sp. 6x1]|uniref:cellulose synthase n=1 Tax=Polyangium sp. 6x1 TaxID=3042689 RepID=UPI002482A39E|nr:cellulose synthase [Polyangium sp. 6x1]MDI1450599.1 cellulose synthase [Polyangium sp. 6x1]